VFQNQLRFELKIMYKAAIHNKYRGIVFVLDKHHVYIYLEFYLPFNNSNSNKTQNSYSL